MFRRLFFMGPNDGADVGGGGVHRSMGGDGDAALSDEAMSAFAEGNAPSNYEPPPGNDAPHEGIETEEVEGEVEAAVEGENAPGDAPGAKPGDATWSPDDKFHAVVPWGKEKMELKGAEGYQKLIQLASMGHNSGQLNRQARLQIDQLKEKEADVTAKQAYYGEIDAYAKANPQWFNHVKAEYQKLSGGQGGNGQQPGSTTGQPASPELHAALREIAELKSQITPVMDKVKSDQLAQEDAKLEQEIQTFKSENPDFGWDAPDENNLTLEDRVVAHAAKSGIKSFQTAARDLLWKEAQDRTRMKTKEELSRQGQGQRRAGAPAANGQGQKKVVARQRAGALSRPENVADKSYDQLIAEGLSEMHPG